MPLAPRLTKARPTPISTSAAAASAGAEIPVSRVASNSFGLNAASRLSAGRSLSALITETGSAYMGAAEFSAMNFTAF